MRCNWTIRCLFAVSTVLLLCGVRTGRADDAGVELTGAVEAAKAARESFKPISNKKFEAARTATESAMGDLVAWLNSGGRRKADGWKKYLKWDVLESQLAAGDEASLKELNTVLTRYKKSDIVGLERTQFLTVQDALRRYIDAIYVKSTPDIAARHTAQIDALVAAFEAYRLEPTTDGAADIGAGLDYFDRTGQIPKVVQSVRGKFNHPNLRVRASDKLVAGWVERDVDYTAPIQEVILGTSLYGTGWTTGRVTAHLVENPDEAEIEVHLTGVNHSNNVGYNGPVTIYTTGVTTLDARKHLLVDSTGLLAASAFATANASSSINSIAARCCIVRAAARRRAAQQRGQGEAIASQRAARRVAGTFDVEVEETMQPAKEKYEDTFIKPLVRAGEFPQQFDLSTTEQALVLTAKQANGAQLAAPTPGPGDAEDLDLSLRAHESAVGNFSEAVLSNYRLTDERLAETWEKLTGEVPEELQISDEKEPWTITFSPRQPVVAEFGDGTARFAIRGREFTRGDTRLRKRIEISANYTLERTPTGTKLTRQDEVAVDFLSASDRRLTLTEITFKTFLRRKFSAIFKESFVRDGLQLGGGFEKRGKMQLARLESGNGWIALGWNVPPEGQGAE